VVQSAIVLADRGPVAPTAVTEIGDDLLELFGWVSDGRSGQGRDHPVAAVLALAAAAVVAGMKGYTAISGWVKDVPLRRCSVRSTCTARWSAPMPCIR
jgi:hypothetical protein